LARGIARTPDVALVAAVGRRHAGQVLGDVLHQPLLTSRVYASATEALATRCDVFVEYTKPDTAKANILAALNRGAHVVIGTSGLTEADFKEIDAAARRQARAVSPAGTSPSPWSFSSGLPSWPPADLPMGDHHMRTMTRWMRRAALRGLAARLSRVRAPIATVPVDQTVGLPEARGATMAGSQIHSIRLPGFVISAEIIFGMPDQKLTIRHDSGSSAVPYVDGALLAIRRVGTLVGLHRGLDTVLDL
jgi:4-hydroxy-tetrahydrodipicolinate reductase